jgi:diguanylate cyclase (GGDEF)-like protein/PAS domain S-box-containing protein
MNSTEQAPAVAAHISEIPAIDRAELFRHLQWVVSSCHQVLVLTDQSGVIVDANDEVIDMLGYDLDAFKGQLAFDFVHPADQHLCAVEMAREIEEPHRNARSIVVRVRHANGHYLDVELIGLSRPSDPLVRGLVLALRNVTGLRRDEQAMAAGDYLFTATSTVASDATTIFDMSGRRVYSSSSLERMIGYSTIELTTIGSTELIHPDDVEACGAATATALEQVNGSARVECRVICRNGSVLWIEATVVNLLSYDDVRGIVVHMRDITERRRLDEELQRRALEDALTGLDNRLAFTEKLATASLDLAEGPVAVLFCDLDGFKEVNDCFGHAHGDQLLRGVAQQVRNVLGNGDVAARIGGDEFCVLSRRAQSSEDAVRLAEQVRDAIVSTPTAGDPIAVSIGVVWSTQASTPSELLVRADHAMYAAKRRGSNLIELCAVVV